MTIAHQERPAPDVYRVEWKTGRVETITAHQCLTPSNHRLFGEGKERWLFHGETDGHWGLLLAAEADAIASVRNVTALRKQSPTWWQRVRAWLR